jgi:hypothetical protein
MAVSDSAQTLYARCGTKSAIVRALLSQLEAGAGAARRAHIAGEPGSRRKLAAFAAWTCAMLSTSRVVIVATEHAASDPAILELSAQATAAAGRALQGLVSRSPPPARSRQESASRRRRPRLDAHRRRAVIRGHNGLQLVRAEYTDWLAGPLQEQLPARDGR